MGFLESVKRTFNISGAEVMVVTEDEVYSQFDRVAGEVMIKGGEHVQTGESIKLELKEFWTEIVYNAATKSSTTVTKYETHAVVDLDGRFSIHPHSEQSYPFEVHLPMNCRVSTDDSGWCLVVTMDIPRAVDPKGKVKLTVEPAEESRAVLQACELTMRFKEDTRYRGWDRTTARTRFRMVPPDVLKRELDYLRLELSQKDDGSLEGVLVFDLQEKSIADYLKAIINRDQVTKPISLSHEQLFLPNGEANVKSITQVIGLSLEEVIRDRQV